MSERAWVLIVAVAAYALICLVLGALSIQGVRAPRGYFMADRRLGPFLAAMAAFSSNFSGFAFVGGPGLVYAHGLGSAWMLLGAPLSVLLVFGCLARPLRFLAASREALSIPAILAARFGSESVRALCALAVLVGTVGYLAVQFRAAGTLLFGLARSCAIEGPTLAGCVLVSTLIVVVYGTLGGMRASIATDALQGLLMILGSLVVAVVASRVFPGGFTEAVQRVTEDDASAVGPFGTDGPLVTLSWYLLFTLGAAGQPHYISKLMMLRRVTDVRWVAPITLVSMMLASALWIAVGLVVRAEVVSGTLEPLASSDDAIGRFLELHLSPAAAGLLSVAALSAIMSSADSFLNIGAAALSVDLPRAFGRQRLPSVATARAASVGLALVAVAIALWWRGLLGVLGSVAWGSLAATLTPLTIVGLNWKRPNASAALAALTVGFLGVGVAAAVPGMAGGSSVGQAATLVLALTTFVVWGANTAPARLDADVAAALDARAET